MMIPVLSLVFAVSLLEIPIPPPSAPIEAAQQHEIIGIVTDISSIPIPEAEVSIVKPVGIERNARTSKDGRFTIRDVPSGLISIQVRRLGYEARIIEVNLEQKLSTSLEVMLKPVPEELAAMTVTDEDKGALREYYEHKASRSSYAKFFDAADIRKRGGSSVSDLFRSVPGVSIVASPNGGNAVKIRGCQPMVWVNGQRIPGADVDEVVSPGDIAGLEFYQSMAGTPAQYMDRTTRACGSILVWTKTR